MTVVVVRILVAELIIHTQASQKPSHRWALWMVDCGDGDGGGGNLQWWWKRWRMVDCGGGNGGGGGGGAGRGGGGCGWVGVMVAGLSMTGRGKRVRWHDGAGWLF